MFDPFDPIDPLGVENPVPYEVHDPQPTAFDPGFQKKLRMADDNVLRRASEQASVSHPGVYDAINEELISREMRRTAIEEEERMLIEEDHFSTGLQSSPGREPTHITETEQPDIELSDDEKAAIIFQLLTTTVLPLEIVDSNDYKHKCKHCESEVRPFVEGPHHEPECQRHTHILQIDTASAHDKHCKHCSARPFVAGFHHKPDCPRGFPAVPTWEIERDNYSHKCKHCSSEVRPISEGPHHEDQCPRHESLPLFHTDLAHEYKCTHCDARPFTAGPHHRRNCQRHETRIAIPTALLNTGD